MDSTDMCLLLGY